MSAAKPRVVYYTSPLSPCGVASYQHRVAESFDPDTTLETVRLPAGRRFGADLRSLAGRVAEYRRLARLSRGSAGVVVDYTDTFFNGSRPGEAMFGHFARSLGVRPVVVLHELPGRLDPPDLAGPLPLKVVQRLAHRALAGVAARSPAYTRYVGARLFAGAKHLVAHAPALIEGRRDLPPARRHLLPSPAYALPPPDLLPGGVDAEYGLAGKRVLVVYGFPQPSKGFDRAVRALAHLPPEAVLVQLGANRTGDRGAAELRELAESLGVGARLIQPGELAEARVAAVLARAEVALAPYRSVHHSSGLGHLIGAGLPVVAARVGGVVPVAEAGAGVAFADCDDPAALARAVTGVLADGGRAAVLRSASRAYALEYSFAGVARHLRSWAVGP